MTNWNTTNLLNDQTCNQYLEVVKVKASVLVLSTCISFMGTYIAETSA